MMKPKNAVNIAFVRMLKFMNAAEKNDLSKLMHRFYIELNSVRCKGSSINVDICDIRMYAVDTAIIMIKKMGYNAKRAEHDSELCVTW